MVSLSLGGGDRVKAEKALGSALAMSVIVGAAAVALGYLFLDPLLRAFGGSGEVLVYARDFTRVFLVGIFFQIIAMTLSSIVRAQGDPVTAFLTTVIGVAIDLVLNPLFIFVLKLGLPARHWRPPSASWWAASGCSSISWRTAAPCRFAARTSASIGRSCGR